MKTIKTGFLSMMLLLLISGSVVQAQNKVWTLEDCINYALGKNVQIQKADLTSQQSQLTADQAKANRLPSLSGSVGQNFNWYKGFDSSTGQYGSSKGSNSTSYSLSSSISLFNGQKLNNKIKQAEIDLESSHFNSQNIKESVGLNILNAYLQVLYSAESVTNAEKQIEATTEQLSLAQERLDLGVISMSDFLQIKSQLATEKSTLATAQSQLAMNKVTLMQLMELPVDKNFTIENPNIEEQLLVAPQTDSQEIYATALGIKPQIKNAELNTESAKLDVAIAKADAMPSLSMNTGVSTSYSSLNSSSYTGQLKDKINPAVGLSLSIPIFQKKQIKTNISMADIAVKNAELDEINTKNELRKDIEQACVDATSAQTQYAASVEDKQAAQESYEVASEKYKLGLINSVDYLFEKTTLITSESKLLQSKYNLVFSQKVIDFYKGVPLTLK